MDHSCGGFKPSEHWIISPSGRSSGEQQEYRVVSPPTMRTHNLHFLGIWGGFKPSLFHGFCGPRRVDFISKKQHIQKNLWNLWPEPTAGGPGTTFHSYQSCRASRLQIGGVGCCCPVLLPVETQTYQLVFFIPWGIQCMVYCTYMKTIENHTNYTNQPIHLM